MAAHSCSLEQQFNTLIILVVTAVTCSQVGNRSLSADASNLQPTVIPVISFSYSFYHEKEDNINFQFYALSPFFTNDTVNKDSIRPTKRNMRF